MGEQPSRSDDEQDHSHLLGVGTRVLQRYVLEERVGGGGMGEVWRARHIVLDCPVAIKVSLSRQPRTVARFEQEARIGASLSGANLCKVLDAGTHRGIALLVMEYLQGQSLAERLSFDGRIPASEVAAIASQVGGGLRAAHQANIVHRDIKPSNIFLETGGGVRVLDFGVAKDWSSEQTASGDFLGTPQYLSPEQIANPKDVGPTSDLWSLALIVYECVVGQRAFTTATPAELVDRVCRRDLPRPSAHASVPSGFDAWFAKATERDPRERYQTTDAFVASLEQALRMSPRAETAESPTYDRSNDAAIEAPPSSNGDAVTPRRTPPDAGAPAAGSRADMAPKSRRRSRVVLGATLAAAAAGLWLILPDPDETRPEVELPRASPKPPARQETTDQEAMAHDELNEISPLARQLPSVISPGAVPASNASTQGSAPENKSESENSEFERPILPSGSSQHEASAVIEPSPHHTVEFPASPRDVSKSSPTTATSTAATSTASTSAPPAPNDPSATSDRTRNPFSYR